MPRRFPFSSRPIALSEPLESRRHLTSVVIDHKQLRVRGDLNTSNTIVLSEDQKQQNYLVTINGAPPISVPEASNKKPIRDIILFAGNAGDRIEVVRGPAGPFTHGVTLVGGAGNDTLLGGAGDDLLIAGLGNDRLAGGIGSDTLLGGPGGDTLEGGTSGGVIFGGSGDQAIYGNVTGKSTRGGVLIAGPGNDTLFGGAGREQLIGGAGNDVIFGGSDRDTIYSGAGPNTVVHRGTGQTEVHAGFPADFAKIRSVLMPRLPKGVHLPRP